MKEIEEKKKIALPLNLQFFADDTDDTDNEDDKDNKDDKDTSDDKDKKSDGKTYTQDELEKIIKDRLKRADKEKAKAIEEAEKLAKMNEEQKKQYELEKLQKELEDYKKRDAFHGLSKEASKMLSEHEITVDDDLLAFVVKDTAEDTQAAVKSFVSLIEKKVAEGVKKALAGKPPKVTKTTGTLTKEEIMKETDSLKRQKLIKENMHLFERK